MPETLPASLRTLADAAAALIRRSSSGRVALARAAAVLPADLLPRLVRQWLPARLDAAHEATTEPLSPRQVEGILRSAWGRAPGKALDGFDRDPLAVRPAAQVHAGELDGRPVVVKVRRPGLSATVRSDLALLEALTVPLRAAFPGLDAGSALKEIREGVLDELDLEHDGALQRQAGRALRAVDGVVVPAVRSELTSDDVVVMDRLSGPTLAEARPDDPRQVARRIVDAHVTAFRDFGLILMDPRPGHVVLLQDGSVGLLGTGVSRPGDRERAAAFLDAIVALREDDLEAFTEAVAGRLELLPADAVPRAHALLREVLGPLAGNLLTDDPRVAAPELAAAAERALDRIADLLEVAARAVPQPADLAAGRMLWQLAATLSRLE